ncbi:MAG: NAD(P)H-hydrate dehydratase [Pirellulaceae bacterium]
MQNPPLKISPRKTNAHKGNFGRVLLVGGSRGMSGSIALSAIAALHTGSGLVSAFVPNACLETVASFHPGIMTISGSDDKGRFSLAAAKDVADAARNASVIGCGPGMTTENGSLAIVERLLSLVHIPRIMDADALNAIAMANWTDRLGGELVLTPHPGELERLTGVASSNREGQIAAATELSQQTGSVIVVKGGPTVVVSSRETWTNDTGNPGMATAGSGDVLTGVITSLLGQGLSTWDAARLGVWIHGLAGDLAAQKYSQLGMTCREILSELPQAVGEAVM